ncbi:MAG: hypothetical protein ABSF66_01065 [Terriglobales bacterium]
MLRSPISRAFVLAACCLAAVTPFFWWGSPSGHDFEFHMFSWMEVLGQWKHGIAYPRWAALAYWGYGEARFLFYPPASWTLGAALGAALPWTMVPAAYCWIVLTLAGAAMYRLAREWLPLEDALFAAVFYALNPYHLLIVYWRSAYAELLAAALLPHMLLCLLRIFSLEPKPAFRPTLGLSLTLAAAWMTNVPAAVMINYATAGITLVFAVTGAARELAHKRSWGPQVWRPLVRTVVRTALAMLLGVGLASFYLLPAIYEQGWINIREVLSPGVRPQDNFLFTTLADPDHNRFNLLVSTVAVFEIGILAFAIWFSRRWRVKRVGAADPSTSSGQAFGGPIASSATAVAADQNAWVLLSALGVFSAVLMLSVSNLLWQHLPELRFVQLPFRWLLSMNAALAMLLAMAARRWAWTWRFLASAILLAAVILAGYRFQPPWWEKAGDIREMSDAVADATGYEGTDEYVPAEDDAYELNKTLPRISDASGAPVQSEMLAWGPTEKHFTVYAAAPQNVTVRLFSYPAWKVVVNGKPITTQKTDVTGLIVIPIAAGDSDVRIHFRRTIDRLLGNILSLISLAVLVVAWFRPEWIKPAWVNPVWVRTRRPEIPTNLASPAA